MMPNAVLAKPSRMHSKYNNKVLLVHDDKKSPTAARDKAPHAALDDETVESYSRIDDASRGRNLGATHQGKDQLPTAILIQA